MTGEDAIDANLASRLAAKNVRWLGRSGCEEVAGLRVGFLGGTYDEASYENEAPDDMSDALGCKKIYFICCCVDGVSGLAAR